MKFRKIFSIAAVAVCSAAALASCSDDDNGSGGKTGTGQGEYVIVATSDEATYLLQTPTVESGSTSIRGYGTEVDNATAWVFYKNRYAYRLLYAQGNAGSATAYEMNSNGSLQQRRYNYDIRSRFTTYGTYGDYIIMAASGATTEVVEGLNKYGVTFTIIDVNAQNMTTKTVATENMVDNNGEYYTVSGIVESDGKIYTALCPQGYSAYGVAQGLVPAEHTGLIDGTSNTLSPTIHNDRVWVAVYNNMDDLTNPTPTIISDDRLSFSTTRMKSQFYQMLFPDAAGDIYVFSASNSRYNSTIPTGAQKSTKPSGVLRIPAGTTAFDAGYYVNLEEKTGGFPLYRAWHISGDYFLLQIFSTQTYASTANPDARKLAIFKAGTGDLTWITGLPAESDIAEIGRNPYFEAGKAYVPVVANSQASPSVYVIDAATATATKGIDVEYALSITAVGRLNN